MSETIFINVLSNGPDRIYYIDLNINVRLNVLCMLILYSQCESEGHAKYWNIDIM